MSSPSGNLVLLRPTMPTKTTRAETVALGHELDQNSINWPSPVRFKLTRRHGS